MTTHEATLPLAIDSTMLTTFRACPRKFSWEFMHDLAPSILSIDLHAGKCFAHALETVYARVHTHGEDLLPALERAEVEFHLVWGDYEAPENHVKSRERMWEAVVAYFTKYPPRSDHIQPYQGNTSEFRFALPLDEETTKIPNWPLHPSGDPFLFAGRFDMLGSMADIPVVRDEKTMKSLPKNWPESFDLRGQFLGYVAACQLMGIPVETVVVRGIAILFTKFHLPEVIKQYPKERIARWLEQTRRDLHRMIHCYETGYFDYNFGDSCTSYSGCAYTPLCTSPEPARWFSTYASRNWDPLAAK